MEERTVIRPMSKGRIVMYRQNEHIVWPMIVTMFADYTVDGKRVGYYVTGAVFTRGSVSFVEMVPHSEANVSNTWFWPQMV